MWPWKSHVLERTWIALSWFCNWEVLRAGQMIQRASFVAAGICVPEDQASGRGTGMWC